MTPDTSLLTVIGRPAADRSIVRRGSGVLTRGSSQAVRSGDGSCGGRDRARRRAHRRGGHLGHRRGVPPAGAAARARTFAIARRARQLRRHVVDAPLPGRALRQRPVHVRLPVQAVARRRRSPPPRRSCTTSARSSTRTTSTPLIRYRHRIDAGRVVERRQPLDRARDRTRHRRGRHASPGFLWMCQGYYRHGTGLHARVAGHRGLRRRGAAPPGVAGRRRPDGQAGRRDRLGRHRRHAHPDHRRRLRARDDAAALARRSSSCGPTATSWPTRCATSTSPTSGPTRSCAARSSRTATRSRRCRSRTPRWLRFVPARGHPRRCCPRASTSTSHFNPTYRPWQQRIAVAARR